MLVSNTILLVIAKLFLLILLTSISSIESRILSVITIVRHGARTPKSFKKIVSKLYYGSITSSLIVNGIRQQQLLGKWMKNRYIKEYKLITKKYNPDDSLFISSPSQRAIFSASGFVQGLYEDYVTKPIFSIDKSNLKDDNKPPAVDFDMTDEWLNQDIPIYIKDSYNDHIFHPNDCKLTINSEKTITEELFLRKKLFPEFTQQEIVTIIDDIKLQIPYLFSEYSPEKYYSMKFLKDLNIFLKQVEPMLITKHQFSQSTLKALRITNIEKLYGFRIIESIGKKLSASGFFDEIIKNFDQVVNKEVRGNSIDKKKFILFSGHDGNLFAILSNLFDTDYLTNMCLESQDNVDYYNMLVCPFASSLIFELHSVEAAIDDNINNLNKTIEDYYVKIIYNGEEIKEGLNKALIHYEGLGGFEYSQFRNFLLSRTDMRYKLLYCNTNDDIDYTIPNNYK